MGEGAHRRSRIDSTKSHTGERSNIVTIALPQQSERRPAGIDWSRPVLYAFAALLCVLIILPLSWLFVFSVSDRAGGVTLDNFRRLFTDPAFLDPLVTTFIIATTSAVACCVVAAPMGWLVARSDMPWRRTMRALVTASFVTPPFLGAIAWELLAAPNSGLLNKTYRAITGAPQDEHLFNIYSLTGVIFVISCYTFPYVFVLVANALDKIPGELEDASSILGGRSWYTARRITVPLALPALLAGALIAFLQAMTLFGSPAILALPAGFHTMTTKIWSLFQYPPKTELAAAASLPLLILTVMLLRAEHMILGRRGYSVVGGKHGNPRLVQLGKLKWVALGLCLFVLLNPVFLPYAALFNAAFSPVATTFLTPSNFTLHNIHFVAFELSATKVALKNTVILGTATATLGTVLAVIISYVTARKVVAGHRILGFLATAPVAVPGIVLGVGLFLSYTRPPLILYGTLWILLLAFLTISLPSAYQQLQAAFRTIHPELEDASRILGASRLQTLARITAPLLRTGVIATWCFIFVGVMRELSAAIILFTSETKVISVLIFDLNESGDLGAISVIGLGMLLITFAVVILVNQIPGLGPGVRLRNN
jgi:iron(III) transport system permease protein